MKKISLLCFVVILLFLTCYFFNNKIVPLKNDTSKISESNINKEEEENQENKNVSISHNKVIQNQNQKYQYTILDIIKTKNLPQNIEKNNILYSPIDKHDSNGNLTDSISYLFIKLKIKNLSSDNNVVYLNSHQAITDSSRYEMVYLFPSVANDPKSYFQTSINSNEEKEVIFGYIINDNDIDSDELKLSLTMFSLPDENENVKFVYINKSDIGDK